jgi:hypothetical protein
MGLFSIFWGMPSSGGAACSQQRAAGQSYMIKSRLGNETSLSPCGRGWPRCEASRTGEGSCSAQTPHPAGFVAGVLKPSPASAFARRRASSDKRGEGAVMRAAVTELYLPWQGRPGKRCGNRAFIVPSGPARSVRRSDRRRAAPFRPPERPAARACGPRLRAAAWCGSPP